MKKFLIGLFIVILAITPLCSFVSFADNDANYYVVGEQEVKFEISQVGIVYKFSIPKGFAFTVVERRSQGSEYAKIIYSGLEGYVKESSLSTCTATASPTKVAPDLILNLSVPKTVYENASDTAAPIAFSGSAMFLGEYKVDGLTKCYAVKDAAASDGMVYYAYAPGIKNVDDINSLLNPSVITPDDGKNDNNDPSGDSTAETPKNKTVLRIILVLGIVIPAFIIILIIFKSGKKTQKVEREVPDDSDRFDDY